MYILVQNLKAYIYTCPKLDSSIQNGQLPMSGNFRDQNLQKKIYIFRGQNLVIEKNWIFEIANISYLKNYLNFQNQSSFGCNLDFSEKPNSLNRA